MTKPRPLTFKEFTARDPTPRYDNLVAYFILGGGFHQLRQTTSISSFTARRTEFGSKVD